MRPDTNRLLVGGARTEERAPGTPISMYARRRLVELIVAFLIIGVLLYIFIPVIAGTAESAKRAVCVTHLRRLAQALEMYQGDYDGRYPDEDAWVLALHPYVIQPARADDDDIAVGRRGLKPPADFTGAKAFLCPSEDEDLPRRLNAPLGATLSSYTYRRPAAPGYSLIAILWDRNGGTGEASHPDGGNVAYVDGRVVWRRTPEWTAGDRP